MTAIMPRIGHLASATRLFAPKNRRTRAISYYEPGAMGRARHRL